MNRKAAAFFFATILASGLLLGATWNAGYESSPAGTDLASDLDTFIQSVKKEVRKRTGVEHIWGAATDDNGLHLLGSARCFVQAAAPTNMAGSGAFNNAADAFVSTLLATTEPGAGSTDVGAGRCWIDTDGPDNVSGNQDDNSYAVWDQTGAGSWAYLVRNFNGGSQTSYANVLLNGTFEATDGTSGSMASGTLPIGWSLVVNNPIISYATPPLSTEGIGVALTMTRNVGDGGMSQTLASLKSDTTFYVEARVVAAGGGTCELSTTGAGGSNLAAQTTASATYTTLSGTFTTTAGAVDSMAVQLRVLTAGTCTVAGVGVYELSTTRVGFISPGIRACWNTDASATTDIYKTPGTWVTGVVTCNVTVPGPGYIIVVDGTLVADNDNGGAGNALAVRLLEEGVTVDVKTGIAAADNDNANHFEDIVSVPVRYINQNPTPGTTMTYTMEASPNAAAGTPSWDRNLGDDGVDDLNDGANLKTNIRVLLVPMH